MRATYCKRHCQERVRVSSMCVWLLLLLIGLTQTQAQTHVFIIILCVWLMAWLEVARRSRLSTSAITVWCCFLSVVFRLDLPLSLISILCAAQLWLEHLIESISFFVDDDQTAQIPNHATQCGRRTISHNIYIVFGSTILFFFFGLFVQELYTRDRPSLLPTQGQTHFTRLVLDDSRQDAIA